MMAAKGAHYMSRIFGAVVIAVVLLLPATSQDIYAQRGSHTGGGVTARPAAPASAWRANPVVRLPAGTPVVGAPFVRQPIIGVSGIASAGRFPHSPVFRPARPVIVSPYGFYPSYSPYSPYLYSAPVVDPSMYAQSVYAESPSAYAQPSYVNTQAPGVSQSEAELSYQVGMLSQQVEQLRQQQAQQSAPASSSSMPTVLVFRDGHRLEIVNYAIIGDTLWALDASNSTKISVADLDLDATQKENRGRGLRFPLPAR
jgi:hypothetical protein